MATLSLHTGLFLLGSLAGGSGSGELPKAIQSRHEANRAAFPAGAIRFRYTVGYGDDVNAARSGQFGTLRDRPGHTYLFRQRTLRDAFSSRGNGGEQVVARRWPLVETP